MKLVLNKLRDFIPDIDTEYKGDLDYSHLIGTIQEESAKFSFFVMSCCSFRLRHKFNGSSLRRPIVIPDHNGIRVKICFDKQGMEESYFQEFQKNVWNPKNQSYHTKKKLMEIINSCLKSNGFSFQIDEVEII